MQQQFDSIGRLNQIQSSGTNYLSGVAYNGASQPTGFSYGNGIAAVYGYNAQNQLASLAYSKGSSTLFSLAYKYTSTPTSTDNDGQIRAITDNVDSTKSATYAYDAVGRLQSAVTGQWGLSWSYDQYGNRLSQSVTAGSGPSNSVSVDPATNRLNTAGYGYDAAGNLTNDGLNALTYDAESRVVTNVQNGATSTYTYDGNSLRVKKMAGGTTTVYVFSGAKVIAEYDNGAAAAAPTRENIYAGSQLLATISGGTTSYVQADQLSARLVTDANGNVVGQQGHYPFGESWYSTGTATKWKFTSYERDAESANDYAMMRYDVNRLGRFSAPDPADLKAVDPRNPQSWNRYAYVLNNPLRFVDPSGLFCVWDDGSYDSPDDPKTGNATACRKAGGTWFVGTPDAYGLGEDWSGSPNSAVAGFINDWTGGQGGGQSGMVNVPDVQFYQQMQQFFNQVAAGANAKGIFEAYLASIGFGTAGWSVYAFGPGIVTEVSAFSAGVTAGANAYLELSPGLVDFMNGIGYYNDAGLPPMTPAGWLGYGAAGIIDYWPEIQGAFNLFNH